MATTVVVATVAAEAVDITGGHCEAIHRVEIAVLIADILIVGPVAACVIPAAIAPV